MEISIFGCILYGLVSGFFSFLPASAPAHEYVFSYLTGVEPAHAFVRLLVLAGALASVILCCWKRLVHTCRELRLAGLPKRRRNRVPDMQAVTCFRLMLIGLIPVAVALIFSQKASAYFGRLTWISLFSLISGIFVFLPQFLPIGTKESQNLRPIDGIILGLCMALSFIPGISGVALMLYVGRKRQCTREFILELVLLFSIPLLLSSMLLQTILLFSAQAISLTVLLAGVFGGLAAFLGGFVAISIMRYMAVKVGFQGFAYYCWGFSVFCFIYYLIT